MKRVVLTVQILMLAVLMTGCGIKRIGGFPRGSESGYTLRNEILESIDSLQKTQVPKCNYEITQIKRISKTIEKTKEEWTVEACDHVNIYAVYLLQTTSGTTFSIGRK